MVKSGVGVGRKVAHNIFSNVELRTRFGVEGPTAASDVRPPSSNPALGIFHPAVAQRPNCDRTPVEAQSLLGVWYVSDFR